MCDCCEDRIEELEDEIVELENQIEELKPKLETKELEHQEFLIECYKELPDCLVKQELRDRIFSWYNVII